MARTRNIKPSFFDNEELAELHPLARLLFIGLWGQADREGRLEDRPKKIKAVILPYDDCDVDQFLQELHESGFILRYEVGDKHYIQIINFLKHQKPHPKEAPSEIPSPSAVKSHGSTVESREKVLTSNGISGASTAYILDPLSLHSLSFNLINNNDNARGEKVETEDDPGDGVDKHQEPAEEPKAIGTQAVAWAEEHWGRMLAPGEADAITGWCDSFVSRESSEPDSLVIEGLRQCLAANARNLNYLRAIMLDWLDNGILTVAQVIARESERNKSQKGHKRRPTNIGSANSRGQPKADKYEDFYL